MLASASLITTLLAFVLAAVGGLALDSFVKLGPPDPYFFVLIVGGGTIIGQVGMSVLGVVPCVLVGTLVAFVAALVGKDRARPSSADFSPSPLPQNPRVSGFWSRLRWPHPDAIMFVRVVVAATASYAIPVLLGGEDPFWAVLVAVLVVSYPGDRRIQVVRTIHRVAGTAVGFFVYWIWTIFHPPMLVVAVAIDVLLWLTMGLAPRNYGLACIAITVMALMMTQVLVPDVPPATLAAERVLSSIFGAVVAIVAVVVIGSRRQTS